MSHQATNLSLHHDIEEESPSSPTSSDLESHAVSSGEHQELPPTIYCPAPGCTKPFTKFYLFKAHINRFHPEIEKRFPCTIPDCPQGNRCYGSLCDLERHYNSVHNPTPQIFPHLACGKQFKRADHLKAHVEVCRYGEASQTHSNTPQSTPLDPMVDGTIATASSLCNSPGQTGYPSSDIRVMMGTHEHLAQPSPGSEPGTYSTSSNTGRDKYILPSRNRNQTPTQRETPPVSNDSYGVALSHVQHATDPYASQQPSLYDTSHATTTNPQTASAFPPGSLDPAILAAESSLQSNAGNSLAPSQTSYEQPPPGPWALSEDEAAAVEEYGPIAWWASQNSKPHRFH